MLKQATKTLAAKADNLNSDQFSEAIRMINLIEPGMGFFDWAATCAENDCDAETFEDVWGDLVPDLNQAKDGVDRQFQNEIKTWLK